MFAKFKLSNLINEQQELKARDLDEERELKSIKAFINNTAYSNDEYWNELLIFLRPSVSLREVYLEFLNKDTIELEVK
ncbi:MAG: hypothetical protein E7215_08860 [Clostridium sulfidigenes]|uniref:Uncharacterized protein n=1 Tax=Clostridium sulfidigenes TaxID=318464 RepID=A0A927ZTS5_9CLOT|nr:hypothetical protein [Clostridium sulfidigenes]